MRAGFCQAALLCVAACSLWAGDFEAEDIRRTGPNRYNWHFGPLFEYRRSPEREADRAASAERFRTYWAFRPFFSQVRSETTVARDFLWPLGTYHFQDDRSWWRVLVANGTYLEEGRPRDAASSFNIFPLWFSGINRREESYWGAFPFYGEHPHFLLMDNWRFALWPVWMDYDVKGVHHDAILWPLVTWKEDGRKTFGVWPFYSHARLRESDHWYALWPILTWADYNDDRDTAGRGSSWMVWPLAGGVRRSRESQFSLLPPFFSYAETPERRRWRLPWPLVDVEVGRPRTRVSVFPFYEQIEGVAFGSGRVEEHTRRFLWVLGEATSLVSPTTEETRYQVWPFWTWETRRAKGRKDGAWRETSSFLRVWPFYSSETAHGLTRRRALDLIPIRHNEGLDRNWSPFWTFWEAEDRPDGHVRHSVFWNLARWRTGGTEKKEKSK